MFESGLNIFVIFAVIFVIMGALLYAGLRIVDWHFKEKANQMEIEFNRLRMEIYNSYYGLEGKKVHLVQYSQEDKDKPIEEVHVTIAKIF